MDNRKLNLLALKKTAGLATASEVAALEDAYRVVGGGLAVPFTAFNAEAWHRRYAGITHDLYVGDDAGGEAPADAPAATPTVTRTADGLILCAPDQEPAHPSKRRTHRPHGIGRG